jgi:hypothetical protein
MVGSFAFGTEGEWTWSSEGNFEIAYADSESTWSAFNELTADCDLYEVTSQIRYPTYQGFKIVVAMRTQITEIWVLDGYYLSSYRIYK